MKRSTFLGLYEGIRARHKNAAVNVEVLQHVDCTHHHNDPNSHVVYPIGDDKFVVLVVGNVCEGRFIRLPSQHQFGYELMHSKAHQNRLFGEITDAQFLAEMKEVYGGLHRLLKDQAITGEHCVISFAGQYWYTTLTTKPWFMTAYIYEYDLE